MKKLSMNTPLVISDKAEAKIRAWCARYQDTEWSGVLYYNTTGTFGKDLRLYVKDFYVCDVGTASYTEYDRPNDAVNYQTEYDLMECMVGNIHSHNKMRAFFSGTDEATLEEHGQKNVHFLSLIVNNEGKYVARLTARLNVEVVSSTIETFGGKKLSLKNSSNMEQIYYSECDIEFEDLFKEMYNDVDTSSAKPKPIAQGKYGFGNLFNQGSQYDKGYQGYQGYAGYYPDFDDVKDDEDEGDSLISKYGQYQLGGVRKGAAKRGKQQSGRNSRK